MNVTTFVKRAHLKASGKVKTLAVTDPKYIRILLLANMYQEEWQNEPGVDWESTYDYVSTGTVSATDSYPIDTDTILKISQKEFDDIKIVNSDDQVWYYKRVAPSDFTKRQAHNVCTVRAGNLVFSRAFTATDPQFGATIYIPAYQKLEELSGANDDILVDDPEWLLTMVAAEIVRNDVVKQNQYPNLIAQAQNLMQKMKENNDGVNDGVDMEETVMGESW